MNTLQEDRFNWYFINKSIVCLNNAIDLEKDPFIREFLETTMGRCGAIKDGMKEFMKDTSFSNLPEEYEFVFEECNSLSRSRRYKLRSLALPAMIGVIDIKDLIPYFEKEEFDGILFSYNQFRHMLGISDSPSRMLSNT